MEGPIIGIISDLYGWSGMFYLMIFLSFFGSVVAYRANRINELRLKLRQTGGVDSVVVK